MKNNLPPCPSRIVFADYIRVIACFLVMLVHSSENFYGASGPGLAANVSFVANEANRFWVAFYDGFVARTCVPLFMIVSAFLLVPMKPGVTMGQFYKRRFLRVVPPMVIFLLLYCTIPSFMGITTWEDSVGYLKLLPFNFPPVAGHLWFLYPLISLYIIIPVVSPWLEKSSKKDESIFLLLFAVSTLVPWIKKFITPEVWGECFWNNFSLLWYCSGFLGYLVMAHYIRFHLDWDRAKRLRVGLVCFLLGSAFTFWGFWWKGVPGHIIETPILEWAWDFCTPNLLVSSFGAFLLFTCIERKEAPKAVTGISKLTFGMYLMHMFFLTPIATLMIGGDPASPIVPVWLAIPLIAACTYICCVVATKLLSLIPGSKWFIGC